MDEIDIYRAAKLLPDRHGIKDASDHAADRITALRDKDDREGARTWGKMRAALLDLSDTKFPDDEVH